MPSSILRPWTSRIWAPGQVKPNGVPNINWKHPLSRGLVSYWFDTGNGFYIDLVSGQITTKTSVGGTTVAPQAVTPYGQGFNYTATLTEQADPAVARNQVWTAPYSCVCGFLNHGASNGSFATLFALCEADSTDAFNFFFQTSTTVGIGFSNNVTPFTATVSADKFYVIVGAATGTSAQSAWVNGIAQTGGTVTSAVTVAGAHYTFNPQGSLYNDSTTPTYCNSSVFFGGAWLGRALTATEATLLYTDPYCFLLPAGQEWQQATGTTTAVYAAGWTKTFGAATHSMAAFLSAKGTTETFGKSAAKVAMPVLGAGRTDTFGKSAAKVAMPVAATGRTDTFGRGVGSFNILTSARGETLTFGRSLGGVLMPVKATGLIETKGSGKSLIVMPAFARGLTETFGRNSALIAMPVSATGRTDTFGRSAAGVLMPAFALGRTDTFGRVGSTVLMPVLARGLTETFGRVTPSVTAGLVTVSGHGLTATFGRAAFSLAASLSARGTTESSGRAQSLNTLPVAARGETQSYGRGPAAFFAKVSARGETLTFGRSLAGFVASVSARGQTLTFGRPFAGVLMPVSARGLTESSGRVAVTATVGLLAASASGLTTTSGRATGSFSALIFARGAAMTYGAAGVTVVAPLLTVSASGQTMTFGSGVLAEAPAGPTVDTHDGVRHRDRYTVSQWAQIQGWLKARRDRRKEEEAKAAAAAKVAEAAIAAIDEVEAPEPVKALRKPIPLSAKARRKLQEALRKPPVQTPPPIVALAVTTATVLEAKAPGPSFAERRAQLRAEWEAVLAAHEDAIEREDEEIVHRFIQHLMDQDRLDG